MADDSQHQDWAAFRAAGIGASDVARAYSGKYGGRYAVVGQKLGKLESDIDPADAQRGHDWEQAIADGVHALTGYYVVGEQLWVTSPENTTWRATIDGLLSPQPQIAGIDEATAVLEVKTSRVFVPPPWEYFSPQVQWQMLVCGKQRALVAVAIIGTDPDGEAGVRDLRLRWIERDDYMIAQLIEEATNLWKLIEAGEMPPPDESTALADVKTVHRVAVPDSPADIDDLADMIAEREHLRTVAKEMMNESDLIEAVIRERMGEATEAVTSDGKWRIRIGEPVQRFTRDSETAALLLHPEYGRTVLDRERFKAEKPELYSELRVTTTDRRLTIREMTND